jgi:hypothetical protein
VLPRAYFARPPVVVGTTIEVVGRTPQVLGSTEEVVGSQFQVGGSTDEGRFRRPRSPCPGRSSSPSGGVMFRPTLAGRTAGAPGLAVLSA